MLTADSQSKTSTEDLASIADAEYKYGFETIIETDDAPRGLNEDIIRFISHKKKEPALCWRGV